MSVEIEINGNLLPLARYVTWTPSACTIRTTDGIARSVTLRSSATATGGRLDFSNAANGPFGPELQIDLPSTGGQMPFFVCGRYDRLQERGYPSSNDRDTDILVFDSSNSASLGSVSLMVRIRKNAEKLTDAERNRFLSALATLNSAGGAYADFQNRHTELTSREIHGRSCFLPWHRAFLLDLERKLQAIDPSVTLPYWRFDQAAPSVFTRAFMGEPDRTGMVVFDASNPLFAWQLRVLGDGSNRVRRIPQFNTVTEPSLVQNDEEETLALGNIFNGSMTDTADFSSMEGDPHGWAHGSFVGQVSDITRAPADPLFFLLHANVDRLWAKWQWLDATVRFNPANTTAYPRLGTGVRQTMNPEERIGNFNNDPMWPWNGDRMPPRPPDTYGGGFPNRVFGTNHPGSAPRIVDMIDFHGQVSQAADLGFAYDDVPYDHPPVVPV